MRLLLTESVLLALFGSVLGLLLAVSTSGVARLVLAERLPHIDTIALDWWVLAFTVAVAATHRHVVRPGVHPWRHARQSDQRLQRRHASRDRTEHDAPRPAVY